MIGTLFDSILFNSDCVWRAAPKSLAKETVGSRELAWAGLSLSAAPLLRSEKASVHLPFSLLSPSPTDGADYLTRDSVVSVAWMSEVSKLGSGASAWEQGPWWAVRKREKRGTRDHVSHQNQLTEPCFFVGCLHSGSVTQRREDSICFGVPFFQLYLICHFLPYLLRKAQPSCLAVWWFPAVIIPSAGDQL